MIDFSNVSFNHWNFILNFITLLLIIALQGLMLHRMARSELQRGEIRQMLAGRSELFYQILTALSNAQPQEIGEQIKEVAKHFMDDVVVVVEECPPEKPKVSVHNKDMKSIESKDRSDASDV